MKHKYVMALITSAIVMISAAVFAADKAAISKNVDVVVGEIDSGRAAGEFKADGYTPYVFIMEEAGKLVVHPSMAGESLKDKAGPVYGALMKATAGGVWVDYEWQGKMKHTYARKCKNGLIVGSGYSE